MIVKKFSNYPVIFINDASRLSWNFDTCAQKAMAMSKEYNCLVQYVFNGITVSIQPHMNDVKKIRDNFCRRLDNAIDNYATPEGYKNKLLRKLAGIKQKRKNDETLAYIADEKFETPYKWVWAENKLINNDGYGTATIRYAEIWAKLMQKEMRNGAKLTKELAKQTSERADIEGITGFMHSIATNLLVTDWAHGAEFGILFSYDQNQIQEARRTAQQKNDELAQKVVRIKAQKTL